ncbi:anthranilate synthase component I [Kiritimatiella glycovorans]|uniref:Anthranilate synthase component 1 n=1 Tax=Kiritimatiella glycovorans TaxID=1307763 RepID=A0A0G3EC57_9BACT|nr:anthranilate synthase component I [Kiritimatiella glycovorans]AKJ63863.1 Anthranilate synthase component 1 [Kiritimatiella glycovorans]
MTVMPDKASFMERAADGNLIPVWREYLPDPETPVSAYARVRTALRESGRATHTFLLESVEGGERIGRYSFIGGRPRAIVRARGDRVEIEERGGETKVAEGVEPLEALRSYMERFRPVEADADLPPFIGGAVGFLGYDCVHQFEPRVPVCDRDPLHAPDMVFLVTDAIVVFDRVQHRLKIVANAFIDGDPESAYDAAVREIDFLADALRRPVERMLVDGHEPVDPPEPSSNMTREQYEQAVEKAKEYIRAGDIIQTVLSQRFEVGHEGDSLDVYRALRSINPSPYMFLLDMEDSSLVGSSPEIHVRCEEGEVEVRPIAGTRPRHLDAVEDRRLEAELLADPKERAEHIMLVDLARNDIGRVCRAGSVQVPDLMTIERYSHVMHIVSDVTGTLAPGYDGYDLLRATFPAGTVSGAPKIRAMEIIAELERMKRGPYAGAVGYISFDGNLDTCITIRTIILDGGKAYVQAGAGIVADSVPANEYEETRNKARGMLTALALAGRFREARGEVSP